MAIKFQETAKPKEPRRIRGGNRFQEAIALVKQCRNTEYDGLAMDNSRFYFFAIWQGQNHFCSIEGPEFGDMMTTDRVEIVIGDRKLDVSEQKTPFHYLDAVNYLIAEKVLVK